MNSAHYFKEANGEMAKIFADWLRLSKQVNIREAKAFATGETSLTPSDPMLREDERFILNREKLAKKRFAEAALSQEILTTLNAKRMPGKHFIHEMDAAREASRGWDLLTTRKTKDETFKIRKDYEKEKVVVYDLFKVKIPKGW